MTRPDVDLFLSPRRVALPRVWRDPESMIPGPGRFASQVESSADVSIVKQEGPKELHGPPVYASFHDFPEPPDRTYSSERVPPRLAHQNGDVAKKIGMPGAYGNRPPKSGWMTHPNTDWIGDDGRITRLDVRLGRLEVFGDVAWCGGTVTAIGKGGAVRLALSARNQRGVTIAEGSAEVVLPRRRRGPAA